MADDIRPDNRRKSVMFIAGEASGDLHGAHLAKALKGLAPDLFFFGIGGRKMAEAGVRTLVAAEELSVVGLVEVAAKAPGILRGLSLATEILKTARPDLLILIDFPDFNLRVAKTAKKLGIPVLYYISPQVWAWRSGRVKTIRRLVDHMAVILPFEKDFYEERGVSATYVGHPLLDQEHVSSRAMAPKLPESPLVGLLPGSRDKEVLHNFPVMLEAAGLIHKEFPGVRFEVPVAPNLPMELPETILAKAGEIFPDLPPVELIAGGLARVLANASAAVAVSGTVTMEAALFGVPTVIIYRVRPFSYLVGKLLIRVEHVGLANLIARERVFPELIQKEANPRRIADEILNILKNPEHRERVIGTLLEVRTRLGEAGASEKTARIALSLLEKEA